MKDQQHAIRSAAELLVNEAASQGLVLTIEQRPLLPLAMGHYTTEVSVRQGRHAPPAQQPQIVGEVLPRWDTEKERVDGVRAHMHKELPIDTKLYAYLPAESKPLFPSGAPEAIEKARNLGMDLS